MQYCNFWGNARDPARLLPDYAGVFGNMSLDPLFADTANGNYRLRSKAGRWDPQIGSWVVDTDHSPCIAAGDPESDFANEPGANGGRINMGAFGNTEQASQAIACPVVTISSLMPVSERARTDRPAWIAINRSGPLDDALDVFLTITGDAEAGKDFVPLADIFSFQPGQASIVEAVRPVFELDIRSTSVMKINLADDAGYCLENGNEADVVLQAMPYQEWLLAKLEPEALTSPERIDPFADPGGYGIPNLLRYAFNLDPYQPDRNKLPAGAIVTTSRHVPGRYLAMEFREIKDAHDLRFVPEYSTDLAEWIELTLTDRLEREDMGDLFRNLYRMRSGIHRLETGLPSGFLRLWIEGLNPLLAPE